MQCHLYNTRLTRAGLIFGFSLLWVLFIVAYYTQNNVIFFKAVSHIPVKNPFARTNSGHRDVISVNSGNTSVRNMECVHPDLNVNDPVMMKFYKKLPPTKCSGEKNWIYVDNGTLRFSKDAVDHHKSISCDFQPILRNGEYKISWGDNVPGVKDGFPITSDAFRVVCKGGDNKTYENVHAGIAYSKARSERPQDPLKSGFEGLSIAILGFDSMSRMSWLRRLPKTRKYFSDTLGAIELTGHNIVGDGTTAVMFPMLTGKFEWELPECRRNFKGATTLDKFPFLWHDMKKAGYLTSWANAAPSSAPFNWRMLGFNEQPTDFYARPYFLAVDKYKKKFSKHCLGSQTLSRVWLDSFRDIFKMYPRQRKFLFHFITDLSHDDNNLLTTMDEDIEEVVRFLNEGEYLNNTLLILMGDHGARYSHVRSTWQGKLEERLPYFSFLFPPWFRNKYPDAIKNLITNTKRLTTPFDIHETFRDFLHTDGFGLGNVSKRGISLFKEIPIERSCAHADIAPHWCACMSWKTVSAETDEETKKALQAAVDTINGYTADYRDDCALLVVANVTVATKLKTRSEVLKFRGADQQGGIYKVDLSDNAKDLMSLFQLTFFTKPGGGHFEMTVKYDVTQKKFIVDEREISRINKYGNDPACILDKNRQIRQYCYCNNNIHP